MPIASATPSPLDLPPGSSGPAWWQLLDYSRHPLPYLESAAARFGTPFTIRLAGYWPVVVLTDPASVRDVFRGDPTALHSGEGNEFLSLTVGDNSILVLDEARHARQRGALVPAMRGERMKSMSGAIAAEALDAIKQWPLNQPFAALAWMRCITSRVILRAALGLDAGPQLDHFEKLVEDLLSQARNRYSLILVKLVPWWLLRSSGFYYQRCLRRLSKALFDFIARRRQELDTSRPDNILDDLLRARGDDGTPFSDAELRDAVVTMIVAGYDTTSVALAWALEQIVPRQDVIDAVRAEIGPLPGLETFAVKRPYLEAAIKETLRLRTIFPFVVRLTKRTFTAGGRDYPPNVLLAPCIHLIHRNPQIYPDPARFDPTRFLTRTFGPDEWLPFGGGNRTCVGMAFALSEMKVVLGTILTRTRLERPPGVKSNAIRRGLALAPDDECMLVLRERPN